GIDLARRAGQHGGVDSRHEGPDQSHLVGIEPVEFRQPEVGGSSDIAQGHLGEAALSQKAQKGVDGRLRRSRHPASSLDRRDAAASALSNTGWMPSPAISTLSASAVVPPGLVTLTRSCEAGSLDWRRSSPLPATVARASCIAISGVSPSFAPAAAIASTSRKT